LNLIISEFKKHSLQYNLSKAELELIGLLTHSSRTKRKLRKMLPHLEKLYDEYKIVAKEDKTIGDIEIRFYICFFKYHKYTFEQIKELILRGYKEKKKLKKDWHLVKLKEIINKEFEEDLYKLKKARRIEKIKEIHKKIHQKLRPRQKYGPEDFYRRLLNNKH